MRKVELFDVHLSLAHISEYFGEQLRGFVTQGVSPRESTALPTPATAIEVLAVMTKLNDNRL